MNVGIIAVCGPAGSGKSSLCFSFSKFLQKHGVKCAVANFDPAAKRPPYVPDFDVRKRFPARSFSKKAGGNTDRACEMALQSSLESEETWRQLRALGADSVLLDLRSPLDSLLFQAGRGVLERADSVLYVADAPHTGDYALFESTCAFLSRACEKPVFPVLNKSDSLKRAKATLFAPTRQKPKAVLLVSALERRGFDALAAAIA